MYALRFIRKNAGILPALALACICAVSCKKEDALTHGSAASMQVVPVSDTLPAVITQPTLLTNTHPWFVKGWLYISNDASLTLEAGSKVYAMPLSGALHTSGIIVTRGSKLVARGTQLFPVELHLGGKGSGVILLGNAPVDNHGLYDKTTWPAGQKLSYGGTQPADSSGSLQNLQLFYSINNKENAFPGGLLLLGTGSKTQLSNIMLQQRSDSPVMASPKN